MKTVYRFTAKACLRTKARSLTTDIFDHIAAIGAKEALRAFTDAWSPRSGDGSLSLTDIRPTEAGVSYSVGSQPKGYRAFGYSFRDDDITEVRFFPAGRTVSFKTASGTCDLQAGLNWSEKDFKRITDNLKAELRLH